MRIQHCSELVVGVDERTPCFVTSHIEASFQTGSGDTDRVPQLAVFNPCLTV